MLPNRRDVMAGGLALTAAGAAPKAFAAEGRAFVSRIVLEDGRVWIAARIGDKGPYFFILDTGGFVSFIDDAFAKSLRMRVARGQRIKGIGGVSDYDWYNAGTVTLPSGVRFPDMLFAGIRSRPSKDAVGTFGAGLFTRYDSDLDFAKGEWRVYPEGRPNHDGLTRLESRITPILGGESIRADASIDGFEGEFILDTGAPREVILDGPATAKSGFWDDGRPYAPVRSTGIGKGALPARIVRAKALKMARFVFERPLITLTMPGAPAGRGAGLIGLATLGRLHLTTDVSARVLYAAPNGLNLPPRTYPLSGLWIDEEKGRVVVADVGAGSPAAAAGLQPGDVVIGAFRDLLRTINGAPGKQVTLAVERSGARRDVEYTLAPWF